MFNFFKKKLEPVTLTFYTTRHGLPEFASNRPMTKAIPKWWKDIPSYFDSKNLVDRNKSKNPAHKIGKREKTVKHCYAIQKTIEKGIVVPLWSDHNVFVTPDKKVRGLSPPGNKGNEHPRIQYPGAIGDDWINYKFESPWLVYTDKPVNFYMTDAFYHNTNKDWMAMPGVMEFYYQHHFNINTILKIPNGQNGFQYDFKPDDIMAYLMPMFENPLIIKTELITKEEYEALEFGKRIWFNPAKAAIKQNIGGCPFHRKK